VKKLGRAQMAQNKKKGLLQGGVGPPRSRPERGQAFL
jgi:hypothetical protein